MGAFLSLDKPNRIIVIRFEGVVTDEVLLTRYQQVKHWLAVNGNYSNVSDFSDITAFEVSLQGVSQLAAGSPMVPNGYMRVVVAPQDEVFGMSRMFEMLGSPTRDEVHIVRSLSEAYSILGIEVPDPTPVLVW